MKGHVTGARGPSTLDDATNSSILLESARLLLLIYIANIIKNITRSIQE